MTQGSRSSPIFHIGVHKTATNWFQKNFYPNVEGFRYIHRRVVRAALLTKSPLAFDPDGARADLGLDAGPPAILCEEDLSGVLHNGGLTSNYIAKELANQLHAIAPDARIVIFIRSQVTLAASCYQQYLREGGTGSVHHYLFPEDHLHLGRIRPLKVPRFDFTQFDFDRLVAHYDSLFGRQNVHVFAYEQFARDNERFIAQFCSELGINVPSAVDYRSLNISYRRGLIPLARGLNLFTRRAVANKRTLLHVPFWYDARKLLLKELNRLPLLGPVPRAERLLGADITLWIRQRFAQGNAALADRMSVDLAALGYAVEPPDRPVTRPTSSWLVRLSRN